VARVIGLLGLALLGGVVVAALLDCGALASGDAANDVNGGSSSFFSKAQSKVKGVVAVAGCMAVWRSCVLRHSCR